MICITEDDATYFQQFVGNTQIFPPVFLGTPAPARLITAATPKALLLLGSFEWGAKQRNLEIVVESSYQATPPQHSAQRRRHRPR